MGRMTLTRRYRFRAVHSLHVGIYRERKHGHDFFLEVTVAAASDHENPDPARINALKRSLDGAVEEMVLARLHARELNRVLEPATGERLCEWIHQQLLSSPVGAFVRGISIQETRKNRFISSLSEAHLV